MSNHGPLLWAGSVSLIEKSIHEVNSGIAIGFMSGDRFYDGYDFDNYAKILGGQNQTLVKWRPGGGFYLDNYIVGLAEKSHAVGRQVSIFYRKVYFAFNLRLKIFHASD